MKVMVSVALPDSSPASILITRWMTTLVSLISRLKLVSLRPAKLAGRFAAVVLPFETSSRGSITRLATWGFVEVKMTL
jgi:hypothetical protein